ncbi:MAG: hypothetical protein R3Y26_06805 [Rikenellaceae bacterium]
MKTKMLRYALIYLILLCCTYTAKAQNQNSSSNLIIGTNYKEVNDTLKILSSDGNIHILSKDDINTTVIVDKETSLVKINSDNSSAITKSLEQDVAILNIEGITVMVKSKKDMPSNKKPDLATSRTKYKEVEIEDTEIESTSYDSSEQYEITASIGGGVLIYEELISIVNLKLRGTVKASDNFRVGLSLSADSYSFTEDTEANSLYMANIMLGFDVSLWENTGSKGLPTRLITDLGYGLDVSNNEYDGLAFNTGFMWNLSKFNNNTKLNLSLEYKYQQFNKDDFASGVLISIGYKF